MEAVFASRGGHSSQRAASHPIVRAAAWISSLDCPRDAIINIGRITGGEKLNVVPERCTVGINYRSLATPFSSWIDRATAEHYLDDVIELFNFPPFHSSASEHMLEAFTKIGIPHSTEPARFYSEAAIFERRGFPTLLWGVGDIRHAHTVNEHIDKKDVLKGKELLAQLVEEVG
jgi:acetylornithine deacetylase